MIFISSPYTHPDPLTRQYRVERVTEFAAQLLSDGFTAFSPVVYGETLYKAHPDLIRTSTEWWVHFNVSVLRHCDAMFLLCLDDWTASRGMNLEINLAKACQIPMRKYDPDFNLVN